MPERNQKICAGSEPVILWKETIKRYSWILKHTTVQTLLVCSFLVHGVSAAPANLIGNPNFAISQPPDNQPADGASNVPTGWVIGAGRIVHDSRFWLSPSSDPGSKAIGITGGRDRQGMWSTALPDCKPGVRYRLAAEFYRKDLSPADAYPELRIWGQTFRLNTLRMVKRFQPLHVEITCPEKVPAQDVHFSFINMYSGTTFWMRNPSLKQQKQSRIRQQIPPKISYFPLGIYGADSDNLQQIKDLGINTAVIGLSRQNVLACLEHDLRCTLAVSRDPSVLKDELDRLEPLIRKGNFSFYVNDEPGIHSFPAHIAEAIQHLLKSRFPKNFTVMAIVRPQVIPDYRKSADFFMLDQYPIPHMPMVWLSESMDEAAGYVGRNRLQSVIQAFGGSDYAKDGWPRLPTFTEMNCLAYLSLIHGSRGVYFFSFPEITATPTGKQDLARVVKRLNGLQSWLLQSNDSKAPNVAMVSRYGYDPAGKPAVHCALKHQHGTRMLLCVNTIRTAVEAAVDIPWKKAYKWRDYYKDGTYYTADGVIHMRFSPLDVKVLIEDR